MRRIGRVLAMIPAPGGGLAFVGHVSRTLVPEDCVGDHEEQPRKDNLRRYADITICGAMIAYLDECRTRND